MRNDIPLKCCWANLRLGRGRQSDNPSGIALPHFIGICLVVFVLGGCVNLSKSYPEKHSYILEAVHSGEMRASIPGTVLKVRKFRVSPTSEGKELVYRTSDARYEGDFYNEWFVPPNAMLTQQIMNWLTSAGLFQYVMDSSGPLPATHMLEGTLTALHGDYRATPARAVLAVQFLFLHEASAQGEVLWHREYRKEVDIMEQKPEALVSGWNEALRLILSALDEDLTRTLRRQ
ncbi:MAG TPA: ABC-type transport auxiliary lipoprotein family protein [Nitrospira sp.]|nr:ABC-type transport auxiliary lipoprotein family protein [Nitrospira sp.]HNE33513.1 ABC-type transport auxiliary lipoprotein family protein [Nitrospira sp.]HNG53948.1 ABC-type transport auxiliary lipoprotein family protein [Nitrospira sp.]HNJ21151.1 ABC-type transport auxiliary lipoprotein family protein [Nitrospira sp.]HNK50620.1 ABC-type transport auxiliary lipoprotein family protein [Nitrospira sp.]